LPLLFLPLVPFAFALWALPFWPPPAARTGRDGRGLVPDADPMADEGRGPTSSSRTPLLF
jgi:hypothetical protein